MLCGLGAKRRLSKISDLIDWVPIRHELDEMYDNYSSEALDLHINRGRFRERLWS